MRYPMYLGGTRGNHRGLWLGRGMRPGVVRPARSGSVGASSGRWRPRSA